LVEAQLISKAFLAVNRRVDAELVRVLYREALFDIIATASVATLLSLVMANALPPGLGAGWWAPPLVFCAGRFWLFAPFGGPSHPTIRPADGLGGLRSAP
jgi:hypothetical protein